MLIVEPICTIIVLELDVTSTGAIKSANNLLTQLVTFLTLAWYSNYKERKKLKINFLNEKHTINTN